MEELWKLDTDALKLMYDQHQKELKEALLEGTDWKEVQDKRKLVTELSIILYHRTISTNPAEFNTRSSTEIKKPQ
ncbi:MAG: hypothetical protein EON98_10045 [Chitinophagaceae bacterium]|nr:MAG: hypothetical protein EON98_10045 [Chitinophagaceae bacterium]